MPRLQGWLKQLTRAPKLFSPRRRYVNRFKIGADPEFVFANFQRSLSTGEVVASARADASHLGLAQGIAFGADNNGRLAEIRPHPSRSAVEVLASILCTFRWLAICHPQTLVCEWLAAPFLYDDGLGGHVHFGRKRPSRKDEILALDHIEEALMSLDVFPRDQILRRRQGDARRQIYGAPGDFRLQQHGYEYRTFPTWLDSPELAFFTLVVSKLAVHMPSLYRFKGLGASTERVRLRNLLAYFKDSDDDARLALILMDRALPHQQGGNFAPRWGIQNVAAAKLPKKPEVIPQSFKPDAESIQEVFDYLLHGKPLTFRVPTINWSPAFPPEHFRMCLPNTNTIQAKGLGEMVWDLCYHESRPISFSSNSRGFDDSVPFTISKDLTQYLPTNWRSTYAKLIRQSDLRPGTILIASRFREGAFARPTRKMLLNLFPVWSVKTCTAKSYSEYISRVATNTKNKRTLYGRSVYESRPLAKLGVL